MTVCVAVSVLIGALFDVASIDIRSTDASVLLAGAKDNARASILMIDGNVSQIVVDKNTIWIAELPHGTACFDVADLDGDQSNEIIAVAGRAVYVLPLAQQERSEAVQQLFESDSLVAGVQGPPQPRVLVAEHEGTPCLALPTLDGLELRRADGTLATTLPTKPTIEDMPEFTFSTGGLGWRQGAGFSFRRRTYLSPVFPTPISSAADTNRADSAKEIMQRIWEEISIRSEFNVDTTDLVWIGKREPQAFAATVHFGAGFKTGVSIVKRSASTGQGPFEQGPVRSYLGRLVIAEDFPDFNGDGFADLLLWNTPMPGTSVESLVRTLLGRTWPVRLTVHMFSVEKERFEPSAAASLSVKVPVPWFLERDGPVRHAVLRDFNGDGKTDLAFCTDENTFSTWLFHDGFESMPNETHVFDEPVAAVELTADLDGSGRHAIVLRSQHHFHALLPASAPLVEEPQRP